MKILEAVSFIFSLNLSYGFDDVGNGDLGEDQGVEMAQTSLSIFLKSVGSGVWPFMSMTFILVMQPRAD